MDIFQRHEAEFENPGNSETQSTEESTLTSACPDGRREKNHVRCLLSISALTLEEDKKAKEFAIGTGWEEAVRGWGRIAPNACIWPRKKLKKVKVGESSSSCLICLSLSPGGVEAKAQLSGKQELGARAETGPEKAHGSPSQSPGRPPTPGAASREVSKMCLPTCSQGEKKSLQIKEFIWCLEDWAAPEAARAKDSKCPRGADRAAAVAEPLASKALVVLPPLKAASPKGLGVLGRKSAGLCCQPEEKVPAAGKEECVTCTFGLKTGGRKGEKHPLELAMHLKVKDLLPFPPPGPRPPLLACSEPCCLHWSFLPEKAPACPPQPKNLRYLATLRLLKNQGMQSHRAKLKAKECRQLSAAPKRAHPEGQLEDRAQSLEAGLFPRPLLPSLTVSRVVIPVSTHRFL
ncbi:uncharacterized protein C16orf46 homolog [Sorex araneus]|uniref:uncharacterized protein C16orf46 homolog n=1 Tax=Sorex araneus TaxID=42254 RepID=UPI002433C021|nr:uncharacterized protein C16orf46 homolog [Sorex araneus]XP_055002493.1 uncharacterized protein C16orf46 homolog [Sorex araneus]XP_055002494.1 uncharacterized protein C16orf46 homolog [Sorex araneus]